MPDINAVIEVLDEARIGLDAARGAAEEWRRGKVAGIMHTPDQKVALKVVLETGLQKGKDGIAAVKAELAK